MEYKVKLPTIKGHDYYRIKSVWIGDKQVFAVCNEGKCFPNPDGTEGIDRIKIDANITADLMSHPTITFYVEDGLDLNVIRVDAVFINLEAYDNNTDKEKGLHDFTFYVQIYPFVKKIHTDLTFDENSLFHNVIDDESSLFHVVWEE